MPHLDTLIGRKAGDSVVWNDVPHKIVHVAKGQEGEPFISSTEQTVILALANKNRKGHMPRYEVLVLDLLAGYDINRKLEELYDQACHSAGSFPEFAAQRFTVDVDTLLDRAQGDTELEERILMLAKRYDYIDNIVDHWVYRTEDSNIDGAFNR
jgi:hypothetical protein